MRRAFPFALALMSSGCSQLEHPSGLIPRWTTAYRSVITEDDRARLRDWRTSFNAGLDAARKSGHSAEIAREGVLLDPDAALPNPALPDGLYRCRVIKLGARDQATREFSDFSGFSCQVRAERGLQQLSKLNGVQRYVGLVFPGDDLRRVFLGTLVLGDEQRALQYGQDDQRDVAGYVERIGTNRWRVIMPQPHFESQFDVMELIPA